MYLIHSLSLFTAANHFLLIAEHVPGEKNQVADAILRGNLHVCTSVFQQVHVSSAEKKESPVPRELWELLMVKRPDWTSEAWSNQFSTILR